MHPIGPLICLAAGIIIGIPIGMQIMRERFWRTLDNAVPPNAGRMADGGDVD